MESRFDKSEFLIKLVFNHICFHTKVSHLDSCRHWRLINKSGSPLPLRMYSFNYIVPFLCSLPFHYLSTSPPLPGHPQDLLHSEK